VQTPVFAPLRNHATSNGQMKGALRRRGTFNARPTELTYAEMLAAGFTDVALFAGAVGLTCCQSPDLNNPVSQLSNRYDYIFERGFFSV
jgi:hypothetical protein